MILGFGAYFEPLKLIEFLELSWFLEILILGCLFGLSWLLRFSWSVTWADLLVF